MKPHPATHFMPSWRRWLGMVLLALLSIGITRLMLGVYQPEALGLSGAGWWALYWVPGLRFDLVSVAYALLPYSIMAWLTPWAPQSVWWSRLAGWLYVLPLSVGMLLNLIDCGYFAFSGSRSRWDLFSASIAQPETMRLLPRYMYDYYSLVILWLCLTAALIWAYRRWPLLRLSHRPNALWLFALPFFFGTWVLALRGGWQLRPLRPIAAAELVPAGKSPLVTNTPFTILSSINSTAWPTYPALPDSLLKSKFPILRGPFGTAAPKRNLVIVLVESLGSGVFGTRKEQKSLTPFLDSLARHSTLYSRMYANAHRSIEGIPAALAGIPNWMDQAYITSSYAGRPMETPASLLADMGYNTLFIHGGENGTMGFDWFAAMAGYKKYVGKNEFHGPKESIGDWGVEDHAFLPFSAGVLSSTKQPFHASIFTLSSHHPYQMPSWWKKQDGIDAYCESIRYADWSLRLFFSEAQKSNWFNNTVFIITADHTATTGIPQYDHDEGTFRIPLLVYDPIQPNGGIDATVRQHIDLPALSLKAIGYPKAFHSLGSASGGWAMQYLHGVYQWIDSAGLLQTNACKPLVWYPSGDTLLQRPGLHVDPDINSLRIQRVQGWLQRYRQILEGTSQRQ